MGSLIFYTSDILLLLLTPRFCISEFFFSGRNSFLMMHDGPSLPQRRRSASSNIVFDDES